MLARLTLRPAETQLRQFGFFALAAFGVAGGVVLFKGGLFGLDFGAAARAVSYVFWSLGLVSAAASLVWPQANRPLFVLLSLAAYPIGWVVSHVALAILFFGVLTPLAFLFRLFGRDPLERRFEPDRESYWVDVSETGDKKDYFRQF